MPITTQAELIRKQEAIGNPILLRCKVEGKGIEFLAFGKDIGDALMALNHNINAYLNDYETN